MIGSMDAVGHEAQVALAELARELVNGDGPELDASVLALIGAACQSNPLVPTDVRLWIARLPESNIDRACAEFIVQVHEEYRRLAKRDAQGVTALLDQGLRVMDGLVWTAFARSTVPGSLGAYLEVAEVLWGLDLQAREVAPELTASRPAFPHVPGVSLRPVTPEEVYPSSLVSQPSVAALQPPANVRGGEHVSIRRSPGFRSVLITLSAAACIVLMWKGAAAQPTTPPSEPGPMAWLLESRVKGASMRLEGAPQHSAWNGLADAYSSTGRDQTSAATAAPQGLHKVVFSPNGRYGWSVGDNGTVLRTRDAGQNWDVLDVGTRAALRDVAFADPDHGWVVGDALACRGTNDGGDSWFPCDLTRGLEPQGKNPDLMAVAVHGRAHAWAVGTQGTIIVLKQGAQWTVNRRGGERLVSVALQTTERGSAIGEDGTLLRTSDGGRTWQRCSVGQSGASCAESEDRPGAARGATNGRAPLLHDVAYATPTLGFIVGAGGLVFATVDGSQWRREAIDTAADLTRISIDAEGARVRVSGERGVMGIREGAQPWSVQRSIAPGRVLSRALVTGGGARMWAVDEQNTLVSSADGGRNWSEIAYRKSVPVWFYVATAFVIALMAWLLVASRAPSAVANGARA